MSASRHARNLPADSIPYYRLWGLALALALPFLCGLIWPDAWWGTHFARFWGLPFLLLGLGLVIGSWWAKDKLWELSFPPLPSWWIIGLSVLSGFLFYHLNLASTYYGNGRAETPRLSETLSQLPEGFWGQLFSWNSRPEQGREGVRLLVDLLAYAGGFSIYQAYRLLDAVCGALFVALWLHGVQRHVKAAEWRSLLIPVGLTSPVMLVYFGHVESYAPVYVMLLAWGLGLVRYLEQPNRLRLLGLVLMLVIGIRLHALMYLLIPSLLLAVLWSLGYASRLRSPGGLIRFIVLPLLGLGLVVYFLVLKDHVDPRGLTEFRDIDRLFLPLFSPEAPLDRYNLFSLNHGFDLVNMMLMWSPALLFLLGGLILRFTKSGFRQPAVLLVGLNTLLLMAFLFALNPLFSMPMDWDLFMFPVPVLLVLGVLLVKNREREAPSRRFGLSLAGFMVACLPVFGVFFSTAATSHRIEATGIHIFKTYYLHASTYLLYSLNLDPAIEPEEYWTRKMRMIEKLEPRALAGNDPEFGNLLVDQALVAWNLKKDPGLTRKFLLQASEYVKLSPRYAEVLEAAQAALEGEGTPNNEEERAKARDLFRQGKRALSDENNPQKALELLQLADHYAPGQGEIIVQRMNAHFVLEQYEAAYAEAGRLLELAYPDSMLALRMNIHLALEAERYAEALQHSEAYLKRKPEDQTIQEVAARLRQNDRVEALKFLFKRE